MTPAGSKLDFILLNKCYEPDAAAVKPQKNKVAWLETPTLKAVHCVNK